MKGYTYVKRVIHGLSDSFTENEDSMIRNSNISMVAGQVVVQIVAKPVHLQGGKQSNLCTLVAFPVCASSEQDLHKSGKQADSWLYDCHCGA